jgi:hypothetical protein
MKQLRVNRKVMILKMKYLLLIIVWMFLHSSCGGSNSDDEDNLTEEFPIEGQTADGFEDGTYCADVNYYNPNTTTSSNYTLEVEVEGNEVVRINFGNGGWLDSDHMTPEALDNEGNCTVTSDRNYEYEITITGKDCGSSDNIPVEEDPIVQFTVRECAAAYSMSEKELKNCEKTLSLDRDQLINEEMCKIMGNYISEVREEMANWAPIENEMNEGYIQGVYFYAAHEIATCHQIIVLKHGKYYWLQVSGNSKCSTGTMKFNENSSGWQSVPVKYSPNSDSYSVYSMKMMGENSSKSSLDSEIRSYCSF